MIEHHVSKHPPHVPAGIGVIADEGVPTGGDLGAVTFTSGVVAVTSVCKEAVLTITAADESVTATPPTATAFESFDVVPPNVSPVAVGGWEAGIVAAGVSESTLSTPPHATLISSSIAP